MKTKLLKGDTLAQSKKVIRTDCFLVCNLLLLGDLCFACFECLVLAACPAVLLRVGDGAKPLVLLLHMESGSSCSPNCSAITAPPT